MFSRELVKTPDVLCAMVKWLIYEAKWSFSADSDSIKHRLDDGRAKFVTV